MRKGGELAQLELCLWFLDAVIRKGISEKVALRMKGKKEIAMGRENHRTFQKEIKAKGKAWK